LEYCLGMLPVMRFFDTSRSLPVSHQHPPREDQRRSTCLTPSRGHWRYTCPRWDHWDGSRARTRTTHDLRQGLQLAESHRKSSTDLAARKVSGVYGKQVGRQHETTQDFRLPTRNPPCQATKHPVYQRHALCNGFDSKVSSLEPTTHFSFRSKWAKSVSLERPAGMAPFRFWFEARSNFLQTSQA
jgi:hypothetical protein